ncbi:peptidylprolyl isomerase [Paucihalobacter ruber]|uniref:Peptidylprolyl isomerase n=1 Tax=Paucihalobacter ruber TaxID=2567861 RepID=A0A506PLC0_9FLAO|nr:peptidylprolyl isomerase [Paucihalobacter ruber]TPV33907.1 peptidylprolyl isomerase [Paucihalobacter ruber]
MLKNLMIVLFLLVSIWVLGQKQNTEILFTVENTPITATEFIRVYNKNLDLVKDESQKDIDNYLDLYINYQLKLKEARRLKFDEEATYKREFESYKKQLLKNYISDAEVTDELVKEAYERLSFDINASHILVRIDATEKDSTIAYNKIKEFRKRALEEGFDNVRALVHDGQQIYGEELGYFSAFKMVYDFETVAYETPVGEISQPFRTQFGYHIVHVKDKRPSRGEVTVAHIMVSLNQTDKDIDTEQRINEIYRKFQQGESFESLAKQFSDDKSSANKGGVLMPFKGGQLSALEFEDVAFYLTEKNEVSKPFKTQFGWHIVKLIDKKPLESLDELKSEIQNRIQRDSRSKLINEALVKKLMAKYQIKTYPEIKPYFQSILSAEFFNRTWRIPEDLKEGIALKIDSIAYTNKDFALFLEASQKNYVGKNTGFDFIVETEYKNFVNNTITTYHETYLEYTNEEYAAILTEYRDGLLLFDLMEKEVWNKAAKDSVGLENYYNKNKATYIWNDRIDMVMASSASKADAEQVQKMLNESVALDDINTKMNNNNQKIIFTKGIYQKDNDILPVDLEFSQGVSKIYSHNDAYHVVLINEVIPSTIQSLEEARGKVVNDYQNEIETNWLVELKSRFPVEVNEKILKKVKSQLK